MAHAVNTTHAGFGIIARIRSVFEELKAARSRQTEYARTYNELQGLTDRELDDIGIRRCDIADLARNHVYCA